MPDNHVARWAGVRPSDRACPLLCLAGQARSSQPAFPFYESMSKTCPKPPRRTLARGRRRCPTGDPNIAGQIGGGRGQAPSHRAEWVKGYTRPCSAPGSLIPIRARELVRMTSASPSARGFPMLAPSLPTRARPFRAEISDTSLTHRRVHSPNRPGRTGRTRENRAEMCCSHANLAAHTG